MRTRPQTWLQFFTELTQWVRLDVSVPSPHADADIEALELLLKTEQREHDDLAQRGMRLRSQVDDLTAELQAQKIAHSDSITALQKDYAESDRRLVTLQSHCNRVDQVRRETIEKLTELHEVMTEADDAAADHLEQLNTAIQFLREGL